MNRSSLKDLLLIPNILTLLRILLIFPGILLIHSENRTGAVITVTVLFLTDFFDGYLARKLNQTSYIGSILDPVADKLVVLSFFTFFYFSGKVPLFYFLLILIRDIAQLMSVPVLLIWKKISFKVAPKLIPKIGTALNFVILGTAAFVFLFPDIQFSTSSQSPEMILMILLYAVSSIIELYILFTYIPRFVQIYRGTHDTFE